MSSIAMDEVLQIIESSGLEDAVILNEHYVHIIEDLPEGTEKIRYDTLRKVATERIQYLQRTQTEQASVKLVYGNR